jgi:hypothetical protein
MGAQKEGLAGFNIGVVKTVLITCLASKDQWEISGKFDYYDKEQQQP